MTFRLNRFYYFKTKAFWSHCMNWLLFIVFALVFDFVRDRKLEPEIFWTLNVITAIYIGSFFGKLPSKFTVKNGEIILWMNLRKPLPDGVTINRRHYRTAKFFVTVRKVEKIEYSSDVEEKVGTFRLYGEILTQDKNGAYVDPLEPLEVVELVGVKSFREARYQLQKEFPEAIFTRIE